MIRHAIRLVCFLTITSCVNHDFNDNSPHVVVKVASTLCGKSSGEMEWLQDILQHAETDFSLRGDIYAIKLDNQIIFLHHPWIMSCFGCVLYDCSGNRVQPATIDHQRLMAGALPENRIYSPPLD